MSPFAGPVAAAALLLALAGAGKVSSPDASRVALRSAGLPSKAWMVRVLGAGELAIAISAAVVPGRLTAALLSASYLGFAWFAWLLARRTRGAAPCGCFGASDAPVGAIHVWVDVAVAAVVAGAVVWPATSGAGVLDGPWSGVPFLALAALLAYLLYLSLTALPSLVDAANPKGAAP